MIKKQTKIVATISDRKCDEEFIRKLYESGMNIVRLNTAHQSHKDSLKVIGSVRNVSNKIPILLDTKGPEMRTTKISGGIICKKGGKIKVKGLQKEESNSDQEYLHVSYKDFVKDVKPGQSILIDDGGIELLILGKENDYVICEMRNDGIILDKKGLNVPNAHIKLPSLSKKDAEYIDFAVQNDLDFIAHSFVRNKEDILAIQEILDEKKSPIKIIAKIENQEGVDHIDEILDAAYGVMIARGDLGIEIEAEKIPSIQKMIIKKCVERRKPVIVATQMLHTMIENPRPTRAEVSDIANAIYDGTDAIMLSGETAYGKYAEEAVTVMSKIAHEVELNRDLIPMSQVIPLNDEIPAFLSQSAINATQKLPTKAIITSTATGRTARYLSALRGTNPVYAKCIDEHVMRRLALSHGVYPFHMEADITTQDFVRHTLKRLIDNQYIQEEDQVIVLACSFGPTTGASFIEISQAKNLLN